jgi:hypothetical protein
MIEIALIALAGLWRAWKDTGAPGVPSIVVKALGAALGAGIAYYAIGHPWGIPAGNCCVALDELGRVHVHTRRLGFLVDAVAV